MYNYSMSKTLERIGMIARWRPVHLGQAAVLRTLCQRAEQVFIGIGSSNRYNLRNPFTLEETQEMLRLALAGYSNYTLIPVPDLDDGPRWRLIVLDMFGSLDLFVSDNPYVTHLLENDYFLLRPVDLLTPEDRIRVDGTQVRRAMAQGADWQRLVPAPVAHYIESNGLDERFRREFGLQTLAMDTFVESQAS